MKKALLFFSALALLGCFDKTPKSLHGYIEAEWLYMAPQESGVIEELAVREGDSVEADALLFRLDTDKLSYALDQAAAAAAAVEERAAPSGSLDQAVKEAETELRRVTQNFERTKKLFADGYVSKARYDDDHSAVKEAQARLDRARAERDAAQQDYKSASAQANLTRQRLSDLDVRAPEAGTVERVYRRAGEVAAAGDPVVALLPPANIKIRFYVPERMLASFIPGRDISFSCDSCASGMTARITFVASEPQFTPPVIYSLEEREKLVFLVEARPTAPVGLRPGLPVDVHVP